MPALDKLALATDQRGGARSSRNSLVHAVIRLLAGKWTADYFGELVTNCEDQDIFDLVYDKITYSVIPEQQT